MEGEAARWPQGLCWQPVHFARCTVTHLVTPTHVSLIPCKAEHFCLIYCCQTDFQFYFFSRLRKPPSGLDGLIKLIRVPWDAASGVKRRGPWWGQDCPACP